MSRRREFLAGIRIELPLLLGVAPFGMIYGALALKAGMSPLTAQLSSVVVFAGSAQLVMAQLIAGGGGLPVTALTAMVLNLRHVLYSAAAAPHVRHLPRRWRLLLAYLLTDEAFAVTIVHYGDPRDARSGRDFRHWFFFGAGSAMWACWQAATAVGVLFGTRLPSGWGLDFAIPLTFIALIVLAVDDGSTFAAAVIGAGVAVGSAALPLKLGVVTGILAGVATGAAVDAIVRRWKGKQR